MLSHMKVKVDKQAFEAFRATLPDDIKNERFHWLITDYSVPMALFLIKTKALELGKVNVKKWCEAMGMAGERKTGNLSFHMLNGVNDDEAMADNIKPSEFPLIVVEHTFKGKGRKLESCSLIIDGNKRLRKAFLTGLEEVTAYYLPKELAKACIV